MVDGFPMFLYKLLVIFQLRRWAYTKKGWPKKCPPTSDQRLGDNPTTILKLEPANLSTKGFKVWGSSGTAVSQCSTPVRDLDGTHQRNLVDPLLTTPRWKKTQPVTWHWQLVPMISDYPQHMSKLGKGKNKLYLFLLAEPQVTQARTRIPIMEHCWLLQSLTTAHHLGCGQIGALGHLGNQQTYADSSWIWDHMWTNRKVSFMKPIKHSWAFSRAKHGNISPHQCISLSSLQRLAVSPRRANSRRIKGSTHECSPFSQRHQWFNASWKQLFLSLGTFRRIVGLQDLDVRRRYLDAVGGTHPVSEVNSIPKFPQLG